MKIKNFIFIKIIFTTMFFLNFFCNTDEMVIFDFHGKKLDDLIQKIAEFKNINILLPQELTKNDVVVNFSTPTLMPLNEIEEYLIYFLSMAGYILTVQDGVFVVTKKNDELLRRYPLPLYVDVNPDDLPDNIGYIRCIYFLKNLKVQASQSVANILLNIMPEKEKGIMIEPRSNCIIVTGPSNAISAAMTIILEIDQYGIEDEFQFLKLKNSSAPIVSKMLEDIINFSKDSTPQGNQVPYSGSTYFSPQIKIVVDARHNGLIFLGKKNAIEKIIEFVEKEIDVSLESGKNIIHVYNLKYLDARKVAPILQSLVNGKSSSGQSIKESSSGSQYRSFDNVRIIAEEIVPAKTNNTSGSSEENNKVTLGGNRLIIAASKDDFDVILKIIEDIDRPQAQVIIEIMILDLELDKQNSLGTQTRIPNIFNLPKGIEFQSVMLDNSQVIVNDPLYPGTALNDPKTLTPNSTMKSDLLSPIGINSADSDDSGGNIFSSLADKASRPGILISLGEQFKNASISSILNLSESIIKRNVIANPYSITKNNIKTEIKNLSIKRGEGSISNNSSQYGGATVVNIEPYHAELGINITPRISFNKDDEESLNNRLNLEIEVNVEDFKDSSNTKNFDKLVRNLKTNANMTSGDLLILGGLQKESLSKSTSKVPFLGDIPLIGMLFRKTITAKSSTNLVIVLRPTIIENDILKNFSCERESFIRSQLDELALSNIKDPITKIYLKENNDFKYFKEKKESSPCSKETIIVGEENDFVELNKKEKNKINEEINFDEQKAKKIKNLYKNLDKISI